MMQPIYFYPYIYTRKFFDNDVDIERGLNTGHDDDTHLIDCRLALNHFRVIQDNYHPVIPCTCSKFSSSRGIEE